MSNYTYERRVCTKTKALVCGSPIKIEPVKYQAWAIIDPDGRKIAEAKSEPIANRICEALNGY